MRDTTQVEPRLRPVVKEVIWGLLHRRLFKYKPAPLGLGHIHLNENSFFPQEEEIVRKERVFVCRCHRRWREATNEWEVLTHRQEQFQEAPHLDV